MSHNSPRDTYDQANPGRARALASVGGARAGRAVSLEVASAIPGLTSHCRPLGPPQRQWQKQEHSLSTYCVPGAVPTALAAGSPQAAQPPLTGSTVREETQAWRLSPLPGVPHR